ncbi:retrovirus-related Pol polyprotein from transposon 412 [Trichonephila clavipes]|nr:retrovirus-related Pol polyprotein from transposon 412 [Trichonephila clavipes]
MTYLAKGRRRDLLELAGTLGITIQENFKILDIKDAILNSEGYDAEFTCECLNRIISDRKQLELRAEREKENQRQFELQKLQITTNTSTTSDSNMPKLELQKLLPIFDPKTTDITIYLNLFERQLTFLKVPIQQWVVYLVGLLPTEVSNLITKESFADAQDYYKVKQILLKRFKLSAENFRQMFSRHTKDPVKTWRDFYFDLQTYFDGWLKESKVTTLEELKDLIVADQIKKKPSRLQRSLLDQWCNWNNPLQLVDKLDSYEEVKNMRNKNNKNFSWKQKEINSSPWRSNYTQNTKLSYEHSLSGFPSQSRRETGIPSNSRRNQISKDRIPEKKIVDIKEDRTPVSCYGCGTPGIIRSRCHTCNPVRQKDDALSSSLNQSNFYSFSSESNPISIFQISICNTEAAVCADTGATHSVAGEKLYHLLKQKGLNFEEKTMQMTLADGRTQTTEILTFSVDISIQGKVIPTELIILKNARAPPNINALLTVDPESHLCQLRKNEDTHLSLPQREEINSLLEKYEECFQPEGEPTPFIEHSINTRNHLPVAVPPYRMNPSKKEILKQEIDRLLSEGIIEECESPYASPVVLIPKPNGTFRLCIDYGKLNEITVAEIPILFLEWMTCYIKQNSLLSCLHLICEQDTIKLKQCFSKKSCVYTGYSTPKNVKELQFFLQTCSWFRRYIQDFAKISRPLSYLTKKKVKWQWGFDQQNAFQTLKNSLTTPPVLKQADRTKPYIIRTDASNYALGAVLLQGEGSDEHPIEYASRLLTPAERNYSTTEREAPCCGMGFEEISWLYWRNRNNRGIRPPTSEMASKPQISNRTTCKMGT